MNEKLNKTEGIRAARLNLQTNGATGRSQKLNFPTRDGEESVAGASQDFLPQAFPQAKILKPKRDGKIDPNAAVESPSSNRGGYFQSLQGLGEEGEVKTLANTVRSSADNADDTTIEIYSYSWKDIKNPEKGREILKYLYWQKGFPIRKIGKIFKKAQRTVAYRMEKYGIPRRDAIETTIKTHTIYEAKPFSGSLIEKAYLIGLRYGDVSARRICRKIRTSLTSTHPAMHELFASVFEPYAHVSRIPYKATTTRFSWTSYCHLHPSFGFLVEKGGEIPSQICNDNKSFLTFLAGFFDSEGCISIVKRQRLDSLIIKAELANKNIKLLKSIKARLEVLGFNPKIYPVGTTWTLDVARKHEVARLLQTIPIRHTEKIWKLEIALEAYHINQWEKISPKLQAYRDKIREDVQACIAQAREIYLKKHSNTATTNIQRG